jgi:two-component system nitrate/nitrite sensor histidine kinase NarX
MNMNVRNGRFRPRLNLGARFTLGIGSVILAASATVFAVIYHLQEEQTMTYLNTQAKALLSQMIVTRQWVADYGGVWTKQPGDYFLGEENGFYLKSPAMVTKELSQHAEMLDYYRFHITSLKLMNPENAPTESEREALHGFETNPVPITNIETQQDVKTYRYMIPLQTSTACLQCHAFQGYQVGDIRGGLSVSVPMADAEQTLAANRNALIGGALVLVASVMIILYTLIARVVVKPIHQLGAVAVAVGQGNYDIECALRTGDELETLGNSLNAMVDGLKRSHDELRSQVEQRNCELATLANIALTISQTAALKDVLRGALDETLAAMNLDDGAIRLGDDDGQLCELVTTNGVVPELANAWNDADLRAVDQAIFVSDTQADPRALSRVVHAHDYRAWARVPLKSKNHILGSLYLLARPPHLFTAQDAALVRCIGNQIGVAVENARNAARVEQMAIVEERNRLAREMHDSIAQALGYLNLKTELLEGTLARSEIAAAREEIADVRRVVRDACYDVRESINGLRLRSGDSAGLIPLTATYLHEFGQRSALLTEFFATNSEVRLPPLLETEVFRIIQEALTNIRKHAQASRVRVAIQTAEDRTRIEIEDDGRGFNPHGIDDAQHFGLRIMRERAERIGGAFQIDSERGRGTRILIQVPMRRL